MNSPAVFDRDLLRIRRDRASARADQADFLFKASADNLFDRAQLIRKELPLVLDLGAGHGVLTEKLMTRSGTARVIATDLSAGMLRRGTAVVADEEYIPFADNSFDAVFSNLSLHWVNDLPGTLAQIARILKPDGVFMAALAGGQSLGELKDALLNAEMNMTGGYRPRTSPLLDMRDVGALLQRAHFALPVVDSEIVTVDYADPFLLMRDLRLMASANATHHRSKNFTSRRVLFEAARLYQQKHGDAQGRIPASFEIIYAIGWKPHVSQQKALKPGSATARLSQALETIEEKL